MFYSFPRSLLCIATTFCVVIALLSSGRARPEPERQARVPPLDHPVLSVAEYRDALVTYLLGKNIHADQVHVLSEEQWQPCPSADGKGISGYCVGDWSIHPNERRFYWRQSGSDYHREWAEGTFQMDTSGALTVASWREIHAWGVKHGSR